MLNAEKLLLCGELKITVRAMSEYNEEVRFIFEAVSSTELHADERAYYLKQLAKYMSRLRNLTLIEVVDIERIE